MGRLLLILTIVIYSFSNIFSQNLSKMIIMPYQPDNIPINICKDENLGIVVFYSAIKNLKFEAHSSLNGANAIINTTFNSSDNCYILCVTPQQEENFSIKISADGYYPYPLVVGNIKPLDKKRFTITSSKNSYDSPKKTKGIREIAHEMKFILGISNGIVAGEAIGFYGELKFGERSGFAIEGGYGAGLDGADYLDGADHLVRWSTGIKGYYKSFFLSVHYGTTMCFLRKYINNPFQMSDDGSFTLERNYQIDKFGVSILVGYDRTFSWFHFNSGIGTTITTTSNPRAHISWNVGVGISFMDLF